jgi:hypothetical protein
MARSESDQAATVSVGGGVGLPPRWFVVGFWHAHRALLRLTRGHLGLWRPTPDGWGTLYGAPERTAPTRRPGLSRGW